MSQSCVARRERVKSDGLIPFEGLLLKQHLFSTFNCQILLFMASLKLNYFNLKHVSTANIIYNINDNINIIQQL